VYRIIVRGRLTDRLGSAFEGMALGPANGNTALVGELRDQSHLFGVLDTVRSLGLELISAAPEQPGSPAPATPPPTPGVTKEPPA
jgi:hypothetical protein